MSLYQISNNTIQSVERSSFEKLGIRERQDLQNMLKKNIDVIAPNILIVAEEFGEWEDSRRRIDLLGIDKNANLVVIELKRTEDGGHMELQSLRYASMISTLTFSKLEEMYSRYLIKNDIQLNPLESLLDFLEWEEPDDERFAQEVKIVLASSEFSKELMTTVMWLIDYGIDIKCVRMHAYVSNGDTLLDVQTVIPIPEVEDYQIRIREKKQKEREARHSSRDLTKYDVSIGENLFYSLNKRYLFFHLISGVLNNGAHPSDITKVFPQKENHLFDIFDGKYNSDQVIDKIMEKDTGGVLPRHKRFFTKESEIFYVDGKTYVLTNQWGMAEMGGIDVISSMFPELKIVITPKD
tara:strand:- start:594 stop:1649 length:1056 start_codon:yes stop_codon:yes gene_type:complete